MNKKNNNKNILYIFIIITMGVLFSFLVINKILTNKKQKLNNDEQTNTNIINNNQMEDNSLPIEIEEQEPIEENESIEETPNNKKKNNKTDNKTDNKQKTEQNNNLSITTGGTHNITGNYECITINTNSSLKLIIKDAAINCKNNPAIYIEKDLNTEISFEGNNTISANTTENLNGAIYSNNNITLSGTGNININSNYYGIISSKELIINNGHYTINSNNDGINAKENITINNGTFNIVSKKDGIQAKNNLIIKNGIFNIITGDGYKAIFKRSDTAKSLKAGTTLQIINGNIKLNSPDDSIHSNNNIEIYNGDITINTGDDAIHADNHLEIKNGNISIENCREGLEGKTINIKGGNISIIAKDDGINAVGEGEPKSINNTTDFNTGKIEISNGLIKILARGDAIDSNGNIIISGGTIYAENSNDKGQEPIDHNKELIVTGGTLIAIGGLGEDDDGEKSATIPLLNIKMSTSKKGKIIINNIIEYQPRIDNYRQILISTPLLEKNTQYTINIDNINYNIKTSSEGYTLINNIE